MKRAFRATTGAALFLFAAIGATPPVQAALAPNYQRLAEMRAVLSSPEVAETFDVRRPLERIEYAGPDLYRASGGGCQLDLRIVGAALPQGMVGPRPFSISAGKASCR